MSKDRFTHWLGMALLVVVGLPLAAEAQLFPHLPIKRKRVDCTQEAPVLSTYRQQYFGHFPTCWRRFPPGWGCPTPEAPNWEMVRREDPLRMTRDLEAPDMGLGGDAAAGAPAAQPEQPALPDLPDPGSSPFDMPAPGAGAGNPGASAQPLSLPGLDVPANDLSLPPDASSMVAPAADARVERASLLSLRDWVDRRRR